MRLTGEVEAGLRRLGGAAGGTVYTSLVAAYTALLHRAFGWERVPIGGLSAGRTRLDVEELIGPFVNPVVLPVRVDSGDTFRKLLSRTRDVVLGALSHQDVPWERLVRALKPKPVPGRNPYFNAVIQLLNKIQPLKDYCLLYKCELKSTSDAKEGMQAFIEKRAPNYTGK